MDKNFIMQLVLEQLIPVLFAVIVSFATWFIPVLMKKANDFLKVRLNIQENILSQQCEEMATKETVKWIKYAEEMALKQVKEGGAPMSPEKKLNIATEKLVENTPPSVDMKRAQELIHINLDAVKPKT